LLSDVTGRHQVSNCYESLSSTHERLPGKHKDQRRAPRLLVSGRTRSMSTSPCAATTRLRPHALYVALPVRRDYSSPAARALRRPRRAPRLLVSGRTRSTATSPCAATTRLRPHALYVNLVVHRDYSSPLSRLVVDYFAYAACLRASARRAAHRSSSTTPPRTGSSSTTSPPPRDQVPRHVAWLVTRLVAPLVVDYFAYAARPGASARRAARHGVRRRLLRAPRLRLGGTLALLHPRRAS
jgi:hypothetical protein